MNWYILIPVMAQESTQTTSQDKNRWANSIIAFLVVAILIAGSGLFAWIIRPQLSSLWKKPIGVEIIDNSATINATISDSKRFEIILEEFKDLFEGSGESADKVILVLSSNPEQTFKYNWPDGYYSGFSYKQNGNQLIIDYYIDTTLVKKFRWSENQVSNDLMQKVLTGLVYARGDLSGTNRLPMELFQQQRDLQNQQAVQLYQQYVSEAASPIVTVVYE